MCIRFNRIILLQFFVFVFSFISFNVFGNVIKELGDTKNDFGKRIYSNNSYYEGFFKNNIFNGKGIWYSTDNGMIHEGIFKNGKADGYGITKYSDGSVWIGNWKNYKFVNGKKYSADEYQTYKGTTIPYCPGFLVHDSTIPSNWNNCIGTYVFANGDKYQGEFKNSKYNGVGTYHYSAFTSFKGHKYIGNWKNGNKHGQGEYVFYNGDRYVGEFKNDKWDGQGIFTWASGEKYLGEFKNNRPNGKGTKFFVNGIVWDGQWKENKFIDGKKYSAKEYKTMLENNNKENIAKEKKIIKKALNDKNKNNLNNAKLECEEIGFKKGTEAFGECILDLTE